MREEPLSDDLDLEQPPRSGTNSAASQILLVIILLFAGFLAYNMFTGPRSANAMAHWGHDWPSAVAEAGKRGKPLLVLFTADWCGPCQTLKRDVLSDSKVAAQLASDFVLLKVDLTERGGPNDRIAAASNVQGVPTFIIYDSKGNQVSRMTGAGSKEAMLQWFKTAGSVAKPAPS